MAVTILHCSDMLLGTRQRINQPYSLTQYGRCMILPDAGSGGARPIDIRDNRWGADFQRLRNYRNPHCTTSGNVSEPQAERPGIGQPGADSYRDDHGCGVAVLGHTRTKDSGQYAWSSYRNLGLFTLQYASQLRRALLLRPHLIGHTFPQSSHTRLKGSPSQTAELCSSGTCRRHRRCSAELGLPTQRSV